MPQVLRSMKIQWRSINCWIMLDLDLELMVSHVRVKCVCLIQFIAKIKPSRWTDFSPYLFAYYFCQYISNSFVMVYKHGDRKIQNKTNTEKLL